MEYYVYIWRDSKGEPFYVGKGKGYRAHDTYNRSREFLSIYDAGGCSVEIVDWFIHESQALAFEAELIERYGRREFGGLLVNKTDGGEGISGYSHSDQTREKMRVSRINLYRDPSAREKMSVAKKGQMPSAKTIEASRAASLLRYSSLSGRRETAAQMRFEPPRKNNSSGYKGVFLTRTRCGGIRWRAQITSERKPRSLGTFDTPEEAAAAYDRAAINKWGHGNCYLNLSKADNDNALVGAAAVA